MTGRYVATCYNDRKKAEWPPHPARLFSALVAEWAEDGSDQEEQAALKWLESQPPPSIAASEAVWRKLASHFVPVNDVSIFPISLQAQRIKKIEDYQKQLASVLASSEKSKTSKIKQIKEAIDQEQNVEKYVNSAGRTPSSHANKMFPELRSKQERFYPSVTPADARVTYIWEDHIPAKLYDPIDQLLLRVARLGHSSSLVSCRVTSQPPAANYLPSAAGKHNIRTTRSGQLEALKKQHKLHQGNKPRSLPFKNTHYSTLDKTASSKPPLRPNTAGEWIVFEFAHSSRTFPSFRVVELASAMRSTIFHFANDPIPWEISGHSLNGSPARPPHVAFLPLPYAGFEHSDGRLLGIAISMPDSLSNVARRALYRAIGNWERNYKRDLTLKLGSQGTVSMSRVVGSTVLHSLNHDIWSRPSVQWVSVTPIALPRHPGNLSRGTAKARAQAWMIAKSSVAAACRHLDLPAPIAIDLSLEPIVSGAHQVARFPKFTQNGSNGRKFRRQLIHASLTFEHPVAGPLILGTGRFLGLGLMRPMRANYTVDSSRQSI